MPTKALGSDIKEGDFKTIEGNADDISEILDDNEREIREALSSLGADPEEQEIYIRILKQEKGYKKPFECFIANTSELSGLTERIREEFGSGFYVANIVRNGKLFRKIEIPILAPAKPAKAESQSDMAAFMREMRQSQKEQFEQMKELFMQRGGIQAVPTDPMSQMKTMLDTMASMKEFIAPPQPQNSFDNFIKLLEVTKDLNGGGGESNIWDVVTKVLNSPVLEGVLAAATTGRAGTPPQPQLTAPAQPQAAPAQPQPENNEEAMIKHFIQSRVNFMVEKARKGGSPELQGAALIEDVPEHLIREHLMKPDTIDRLIAINPEVRTHRAWFEQVQKYLVDELGATPT